MEALSSGQIEPPLEGSRFDLPFIGSLRGPKLKSKISGIDHLYVRAGGRYEFHIHATINTDDDHNISFSSTGISSRSDGTREIQLRAMVPLFSSSPAYLWMNHLPVWAQGSLDPENGKAFIKAYEV